MLENKIISWDEIVSSYKENPRDVKTAPMRKDGIWFYVYAEASDIYIENAKNHLISSKIKVRRKIEKEKFNLLLLLYYRRKNGESVTKEAIEITYNQVYWYGIFADMGL